MDVGTFAFKIWKWICIKIWNSPWKPKINGYWDFKVFKVFFPFLFLVSPALLQSNVQNFLGAQVGVEIKMDIGISLPNLIIFLMKWTFILISIQRQCPFLFFFCCFSRKTGRQLRVIYKKLERLFHKVNSSSFTIDQTTVPDVSPPSTSTSVTTTTDGWAGWDDDSQDWVYTV